MAFAGVYKAFHWTILNFNAVRLLAGRTRLVLNQATLMSFFYVLPMAPVGFLGGSWSASARYGTGAMHSGAILFAHAALQSFFLSSF